MKKLFPYVVLLAAFALAGSAAYYSVFGLSKLFSSQASAIIILAGTLEASKLITASYLHRYWTKISTAIKTYMMTAVFVLMCITSLGIYGFLVSAYQDTAYKMQNLETILGLEFVGEEIDTFVTILKKIHDANTDDGKVGFKINKAKIEFTKEELELVDSIYLNFKPVNETQENDISNGTNS